jgi:hypothetical protein
MLPRLNEKCKVTTRSLELKWVWGTYTSVVSVTYLPWRDPGRCRIDAFRPYVKGGKDVAEANGMSVRFFILIRAVLEIRYSQLAPLLIQASA